MSILIWAELFNILFAPASVMSDFLTVNEEHFDLELLVGVNKSFEDIYIFISEPFFPPHYFVQFRVNDYSLNMLFLAVL